MELLGVILNEKRNTYETKWAVSFLEEFVNYGEFVWVIGKGVIFTTINVGWIFWGSVFRDGATDIIIIIDDFLKYLIDLIQRVLWFIKECKVGFVMFDWQVRDRFLKYSIWEYI